MAMVRVRVNAAVHDWRRGEIVTIERTPRIAGMIKNGYLSVIDEVVPDFAPDDPEVSGDSPVTPRTAPNWSNDQPPVRVTYRRSENDAGTTEFGDPLPAGGGGGGAADPDLSAGKFIVPDTIETPTAAAGSVGTLGVETQPVPPRTGKGSGVEAWREFVQSQNLTAPADASRDDLIAVWDAEQARRREPAEGD